MSPTAADTQGESVPQRHPERLPYYPRPRCFDPQRPVKLIIVGAGIAGIASAILIPRKVPNLSYVVFDKNKAVGGTWATNIYPGVRCDVPSHCYQLTFEPNLQWSQYYSPGSEIQAYYERVAEKYGVTEHLRLQHEVIKATWLDEVSQWSVQVKDLQTGKIHTELGDFLVSGEGRLSQWKMPDIPNLHLFQGHIRHTANWDPEFDYKDKSVAVIGNGASGLQVLSALFPYVSEIHHYVQSKVWILPALGKDYIQATAESPGGVAYTKEQQEAWANNPSEYLDYRRRLELGLHSRWGGHIKGSTANDEMRKKLFQYLSERLEGNEDWLKRLIPNYSPGCKRLTPAPGYIEALLHPKTQYIDTKISHATSTGLVTEDGQLREVDAIIAATGFTNGYLPRFPTIGKDGIDLQQLWAADGPIGFSETYLGIMAPNIPNYFFVLQSQGNPSGGSIPLQCEVSATYIAKVIRKVQSQSYKAVSPSQEATDDFNDIINGYFENTTMADSCHSWAKSGPGKSRVLLVWPGTGHHRIDILRDPRWEDFVFERFENSRNNRFDYFGNGSTAREARSDPVEITKYLKELGTVDLATLHENWND